MDNEFDFYGSEYVEDNVEEIKGITDKVTPFTYTGMDYPCMVIKDNFVCPKHRMLVIRNMVQGSGMGNDISLYFAQGSDLYKLGMLSPLQVKVFVEMVGKDNLVGYLSEDQILTKDMLYVLYMQPAMCAF